MLQECLTFSEIGDYLRCSPDPSCKVNLLGLTEESIHNQNPHRKVRLITCCEPTFICMRKFLARFERAEHHNRNYCGSSLFVRYNIHGFCGYPLPMNLHLLEGVYKHLLNMYLRSRTCYQQNYVSTNQVIFVYPQTLTPSE